MRTITRPGFLLLVLSFVFLSQSAAQWQQTNGPCGGNVNVLGVSGTTLLAGTDVGIYRSTDKGTSWGNPSITSIPVHAFITIGSAIFAGTDDGIYRSTDNGASWGRPNTKLQSTPVYTFALIGSTIFCGTDDGVFRSSDGGSTWILAHSFVSQIVTKLVVLPNAAGGTRLIAGCRSLNIFETSFDFQTQQVQTKQVRNYGDIWSSSDNGATWEMLTQYSKTFFGTTSAFGWVPDAIYQTLAVSGNRLFAVCSSSGWLTSATSKSYYMNFTTDMGRWEKAQNLPTRFLNAPTGGNPGLYYIDGEGFLNRLDSTNSDETLQGYPTATRLGVVGTKSRSLAGIGQDMFVATEDRGALKSTDNGKTWTQINSGMVNSDVSALVLVNSGAGTPGLVAATRLRGSFVGQTYATFRSTDQGTSWSATESDIPEPITAMATVPIGTSGQTILAGTAQGLLSSSDFGATWTLLASYSVNGIATATVQGKTTVFIAHDKGLASSTDITSNSWVKLGESSLTSCLGVCAAADSTGTITLYVSTGTGGWISKDNGSTWNTLHPYFTQGSIAVSGSRVYFASPDGVTTNNYQGILGTYWRTVLSGIQVNAVCVCGTTVFAGTDSLGIFKSTDDGTTWDAINVGLHIGRVTAFAYDGSSLYIGTGGGGVFRYTNSLEPDASIAPSADPQVTLGVPYLVNVTVGSPARVKDLWDISFDLVSSDDGFKYVDSSATYGPFLTEAAGTLHVVPQTVISCPVPTYVHIYLKRMLSGGVTGSGILAKAQFSKSPTSPVDLWNSPKLSIKNIIARNSKKERLSFHPIDLSLTFVKGNLEIWPGDCNNDGVVNANDILPLGLHFQKTNKAASNPGILWQAYRRDSWSGDSPPKMVFADANGDGIVNSADLLAVGLNYGKTHPVAPISPTIAGNSSLGKVETDGQLSIVSLARESERSGRLRAVLRLSSPKPVYGIGFTLKYDIPGTAAPSVRFIQADTSNSVLGGGLMFTMPCDGNGRADIAITRINGLDFSGDGNLMSVSLDAPATLEQNLRLETCQIVGNDAQGNPVSISGSVYQTAATGVLDAIPLQDELLQNYPNPFNPSTLIRFELSTRSSVTLKIYDVLGRELAVLVNGVMPSGRHSATWDAASLPSGVYFYTLTINGENKRAFVQTRRMMLVR